MLRRHIPDALGVVAAITYALPSLAYPFGMDQPCHWYVGRRWLEGLVPYATAMDIKPPGVFAVHALSIAILGDSMWVVRVVDLAFVLATGGLIATFRARSFDGANIIDNAPRRPGELGAACVLVSTLTYTFFDWTSLGHPDLWLGVAVLLAAWIVLRAPGGVPSPRRAFAAGAALVAAMSLKHVGGVSVAFGLVAMGLAFASGGARAALRVGLAYMGGAALGLALVVLPFALTGTLGPLREANVDAILGYVEASRALRPTPRSWPTWEQGLLPLLMGPAMALGGVTGARFDRDRATVREGWLALCATLCAFTAVAMQGRAHADHFAYHWLAAVPALALGIAWGLRRVAPAHGGAQLAAALALGVIAFAAAPEWLSTPLHSYRREWAMRIAVERGELDPLELERAYHAHQPMVDAYVWQRRVADRVRELARPGDTLCVDGFFGAIHPMTGLDCPSRQFIPPHAMDGALPGWFEEHERMFERTPPTFYVTVSDRRETIARRLAQGYVLHEATPPMRFRLVILARAGPRAP